MFIKGFKNLKETIKTNKRQMHPFAKKYLSYFENGLYVFDYMSGIIYKLSYRSHYKHELLHTYNGFFTMSQSTNIFHKIASFCIRNRFLIIRNNKRRCHNTVGVINNERDVIKLFDYKMGTILTIFKDKTKLNLINDGRTKLKKMGYNVTQVLNHTSQEPTHNYIFEPMIKKVDYDFEDGLNNYIKEAVGFNYDLMDPGDKVKSTNYKYSIIRDFLITNKMIKERNQLDGFIKNNYYCITICHGDFYPFNYIYDGNLFYTIDYETVTEKIFFYDFIYYICRCYISFQKYNLLHNFFIGKYDNFLKTLFSRIGAKYDPDAKELYLIITIFEWFDFVISNGFNEIFDKIMRKRVNNYNP